jgi:uncharacterized protein (TIRG00374 family)
MNNEISVPEKNEKTKKNKLKSVVFFLIKILIAFGIIFLLVRKDYSKVLKAIENFDFIWLLPIIICYIFHLFIVSWRWHLLTKILNVKMTLWEAVSLTMSALFCSLAIPGGAIGGDLAKIGFLSSRAPKGRRLESSFTIIIDRFTGMIGLFSIAIVVVVFSWKIIWGIQEDFMKTAVILLIILCLTGLAAAFCLSIHKQLEKIKPLAFMIKLANKYTHGMYERMSHALDIYKNEYKLIFFCILISIIFVHLNMAFVVFLICKGLGLEISLLLVLVATTLGNTAGVLPLPTPSGVGVRDAIIRILLMSGGIAMADATAVPLIYTAIILAFNLSGGFFFFFGSKRKTVEAEA